MEYSDWKLNLFVPSDPVQRRICYSAQLPETLVASHFIDNPAARGTFATVLREPLNTLDDILTEYGITELPILEPESPVVTDGDFSDDEGTAGKSFMPMASIVSRDEAQLQVLAKPELQLSLRLKDRDYVVWG